MPPLPPANAGPTVTITAEARSTETQLVVAYHLRNGLPRPIYVRDQMIGHKDQTEVIDPDAAYVCWQEPKTVRLARAVLPLPTDFDIYKMEVPYARKVAPGATIEGKIVLAKPVHEISPYYSPAEKSREVDCNQVHLVVGWAEEQHGMEPKLIKVGDKEVYMLRGSWKGRFQELSEATAAQPVKLLVREDKFDRRMPMR